MGLVLVLLDPAFFGAREGEHVSSLGYDALPDVLGWLLVWWGVRALPADLRWRGAVAWWVVVAGITSIPLWVPAVLTSLSAEAAWAASLPQSIVLVWLSHGLANTLRAEAPADHTPPPPFQRLRLLTGLFAVLAVAPAVVLGGDLPTLAPWVGTFAVVAMMALIWTVFTLHRRIPPAESPAAADDSELP